MDAWEVTGETGKQGGAVFEGKGEATKTQFSKIVFND